MPHIQQVKADSKMTQHKKPLLATALLGAALLACAPVVDNRGYVFDDRLLETLQKDVTSMNAVRDTFGSPTTITSLNGDAFYYVHSRFVTESYRAPREVDRKVLALYFNSNKKLTDYAVYGLEDGIIVPIVSRTTQSQGKELTIVEQLFENLGRLGDEAPGSDL
ncbi:MAG: outer membrane protein assembly factor BamE [Parvibaculales bacterium]